MRNSYDNLYIFTLNHSLYFPFVRSIICRVIQSLSVASLSLERWREREQLHYERWRVQFQCEQCPLELELEQRLRQFFIVLNSSKSSSALYDPYPLVKTHR